MVVWGKKKKIFKTKLKKKRRLKVDTDNINP